MNPKMKAEDTNLFRAGEMMVEANRQLQNYFRKSRRYKILKRKGIILFVDDEPKQVTILEYLLKSRHADIPVVAVDTIEEAKKEIERRGKDDIRVIIIDLSLENGESGENLIDWIRTNCREVPFIVSTGHINKARELPRRIPGAEVFIKGQTPVEEFADALGLPRIESNKEIIPQDSSML